MSYDTAEAARLISWSNQQKGIEPLTEAELAEWIGNRLGKLKWADVLEEDGRVTRHIDFPTLTSIRLICLLRSSGVTLKDIDEAAPLLRKQLGVEWPYASRVLWNSPEPQVRPGNNEAVGTVIKGLLLCSPKLAPHGLEFGADGVASAWLPAKGVVIDPHVVSGSPCVAGTRTPTWAFAGPLTDGDNIEELANAYRLSKEQIRNALDWERQIDAAGA